MWKFGMFGGMRVWAFFFVFVKLSVLKSWDLGVLEVCEGWRVGSFFCGNLGVYDS